MIVHARQPRPLPDRCTHCGKVCWPGRSAAEQRAKHLRRNGGERGVHAYCCKAGRWHLGHGARPIRIDREAE